MAYDGLVITSSSPASMYVLISNWIASSVPLVIANCAESTSKNEEKMSRAELYSGYMATLFTESACTTAAVTVGEHPTVFSLKSSRTAAPLPCVGGEYACIFTIDLRGFIIPHFHAACMGFQTFCTRQHRDRGLKCAQRCLA